MIEKNKPGVIYTAMHLHSSSPWFTGNSNQTIYRITVQCVLTHVAITTCILIFFGDSSQRMMNGHFHPVSSFASMGRWAPFQSDFQNLAYENWTHFTFKIRVWIPSPWVGKIPWRRKWQPTPVFFLGESHGRRSLVSYSPQGCKESDMTKRLHLMFSRKCWLGRCI